MRTGKIALILLAAALSFLPAGVHARGFGGGGGGGGGGRSSGGSSGGGYTGGGRSYGGGGVTDNSGASRGFSDGYGSIRYSSPSNSYGGGSSYRAQTPAPRYDSSAGTQRPMNYGSIQNSGGGQVTKGEYGGGAGGWGTVNAKSYGGGNWSAARGPGGGAAVGRENAFGGGSAAVRGSYGGSAGAWHGAGGARAGHAEGPWGGAAAGVRGPNVGGAVTHLPDGYNHTNWHGNNYWHHDHHFYRPYWYGGNVYYWPVLPPTGYWFGSLPDDSQPVAYNNYTYYTTPDGAYYQAAQQDGQSGYAVVDPPPAAAAAPAPADAAAAADAAPDPFQILQRMSDYMAAQKQFQMVVQDAYDEVSDSGQKIQLTSTRTIIVQRPDKLAVDFHSGDTQHRRIVYDGKQVTAIDYAKEVYGVIPVPDTLDAALDKLAKDYGMALPVSDLLYTDTFARLTAGVTGEMNLGEADIDDQPCYHLAFTAPDTNWEIWIQQGDKPIPRKILINYINQPESPQYIMEITDWKVQPPPSKAFDISIPSGINKIDILPTTAPAPVAQP